MLRATLEARGSLQSTNDYTRYRRSATKKVHKLRKNLSSGTKSGAAVESTTSDIALTLAERAWATAKEASSELEARESSTLRGRVTRKLAKACKWSQQAIMATGDSADLDILVYDYLLKGDRGVELHQWSEVATNYCAARVGLEALSRLDPGAEIYADCIAGTLDPVLQVALAQSEPERRVDIARYSLQKVAGSPLAKKISEVCPEVLDADGVEPCSLLGTIVWRGHEARITDADLAQRILSARDADAEKGLILWQDAVDILDRLPQSEELAIAKTYVKWNLLTTRIYRLASEPPTVRVFDQILQSAEELNDLPGVFSDETLVQGLNTLVEYYQSRRLAAVSLALREKALYIEALAVVKRAMDHLSIEDLGDLKDLPISDDDVKKWKSDCHLLLIRSHGLAAIASEIGRGRDRPLYVSDDISKYPGTSDSLENIANIAGHIEPVPVRPVFYDIALNHLEPDEIQSNEAEPEPEATTTPERPAKRGLFGLFK